MMAVSCTFYQHMLGDMVWICHFLFLSRAQLILYKDNAKRVQQQVGKTQFYQT